MNLSQIVSTTSGTLVALGLTLTALPAVGGEMAAPVAPIQYTEPDDPARWQMALQLYGWIAGIDSTTATGDSISVDFEDILEDLSMTVMGTVGARKGRWAIGADLVYLNLSASNNLSGPLGGKVKVDLENVIVTPVVGYTVADGPWGTFDLLAGARYLYIDTSIKVVDPINTKVSESASNWAGIVGVRGRFEISEKWFATFYGDIGAGDPDLTWQLYGAIGYHFDSFDLIAGYRYMRWDFESGTALKDLEIGGPIIGAAFKF